MATTPPSVDAPGALDVARIRDDFPALHQEVNGHPLIYLDNAASSQKPSAVIDRISEYYSKEHSNVHRGVHALSQKATDAYEAARRRVQGFIGAEHEHEVIFTGGTTAAINLVAYSFGARFVGEGDEIVVSAMEHHANLVPWQLLCERTGARLRVIPMNDAGELKVKAYRKLLNERTRLVALCYVSNTLGTINPVRRMIKHAHALGIPVLLDAAQAAPHMPIDVQALDCDFLCFSAHKAFGPTGIGALYGKERLLEEMPPFLAGGDMIQNVTLEHSTFNELPHKFEAGTPHIAGVIGMAEALAYMERLGLDAIEHYEHDLLDYATDALLQVPDLRLIGRAAKKASVLSFLVGDIHPYDVGTMLDTMGIATRTGNHCTQPIMQRFNIPGTVRASLAFYNTREEVDRLADALMQVIALFR